jgi:hypothetical protein
MWEVNLAIEEVSGGREGFGDVGKHVNHRLVDASPVGTAVDPLAILGKSGEVDGVGCVIPAEVGEFGAVAEPVIEWCLLGREFGPGRSRLVQNRHRGCGNAVYVEPVEVAQVSGH